MITDKELEEFKELFRKHFNKELTNAEAMEKATALINMVRIVYKPIPEDKKNELETPRQPEDKGI